MGTLPPHWGGGSLSNAEVLSGLLTMGHDVWAIVPGTPETEQSPRIYKSIHPCLRVTTFLVPGFEADPFVPRHNAYAEQSKRVRKAVKAHFLGNRPDVVFIGRGSFVLGMPDLVAQYDIPTFITLRGTINVLLEGKYPKALRDRLLKEYRRATLAVTPAHHLAERLREAGFENVKAIANGVDLERFRPGPKSRALLDSLKISESDLVVAHVSNMKAVKRPLDIVASAEKALRQCPSLIYVIVGDGPTRADMENACNSRGLAERFRFVGWVDYKLIADYFRLADMVVMPSESEGLSRVYLESQACSKVLLASGIPAAREVIAGGETGLLFRKADIDDLTAKTLLAAVNGELRARIGRKARAFVEANHSLQNTIEEYAATLTALVGPQRASCRPQGHSR